MQVYIRSEQEWIDFVNGRHVVAHREPVEGYYRAVLVAPIEVLKVEPDTVTIIKRY